MTPSPATVPAFSAGASPAPPAEGHRAPAAWRRALTASRRAVADMAWRDSAARWGWPGALAVLCLAVAAVLMWAVVPAQQRESADLAQRAATTARNVARQAARARSIDAALPPGQRLAATLPDASSRQQRVAALLALAAEAGVAVRSAEFKLVREPAAAQLQYTITLPVNGPYAALRGFIETALRADPALSLDRMQLRRASPTATLIDAELVWSLHMRTDPAQSAAVAVATVAAPSPAGRAQP